MIYSETIPDTSVLFLFFIICSHSSSDDREMCFVYMAIAQCQGFRNKSVKRECGDVSFIAIFMSR